MSLTRFHTELVHRSVLFLTRASSGGAGSGKDSQRAGNEKTLLRRLVGLSCGENVSNLEWKRQGHVSECREIRESKHDDWIDTTLLTVRSLPIQEPPICFSLYDMS